MPARRHHNLDVTLRADGEDHVVLVDGEAGEFRGTFTVPFAPYEVENFVLKLGDRPGVRRAPAASDLAIRHVGGRLFDALFHGPVEQALRESQARAARADHGVRIRLRLRDAPALAALPWEFLYDTSEYTQLAMSTETPIVRYVDMGKPVTSLTLDPPLRVLAVLASPRDVEELDTTQEFHDLQEALRTPIREGRIELHGLHRATASRLRDALGTDTFHILHFMGHGVFDEATETGMLALEDDEGYARPLTGHDLGLVLHDHRSLQMVVLNACEGGRTSLSDPVGGVAQSIVHHDIPAVVGMQAEISDPAATCFSGAFYRHIGRGSPVDVAMAEARMEVYMQGHGAEWGIPILYLRARDGDIFDLAGSPAPPDPDALRARARDLRAEGGAGSLIAADGLDRRARDLGPDDATPTGDLGHPPPGRPPAPPRPAAPPRPHADEHDRTTPARSSRLLARTQDVLVQARSLVEPDARPIVGRLVANLRGPLRIAVAGRVGAGKSTLVNALLGQPVAPTLPCETARVVTWYRHGDRARAALVLQDGDRRDLPIPDGRLPETLPMAGDEVDRLDVWLPVDALRRHTLVDTPGVAALGDADGRAERALLARSRVDDEPAAADAMVYVVRGTPEEDELAFLRRRLEAGGGLGAATVNVLGVLTHADLAGGGPWAERDPVEVADEQARALAERAAHRAADVVAVAAELAVTARSRGVAARDASLLATLVDLERGELGRGPTALPPGTSADEVRRLVTRCGEYVLARGRRPATDGVAALSAWLERRSRIPRFEVAVRRHFLVRSAALRADTALRTLASVADAQALDPSSRARILALVEAARSDPDLHPLREIDALRAVAGVDASLHRELLRVSGGGSLPERVGLDPSAAVADVAGAARASASRAQRVVATALDPRAAAAARTLSTSYHLLGDEARSLGGAS